MKRPTSYIVTAITIVLLIIIFIVIVFKYKSSMESFPAPEQIYVAKNYIELPDHNVIQVATDDSQTKVKGWIGAQLTDLPQEIKDRLKFPDLYGVYVQDTHRSSPAQKAGILPGDIITRINNFEIPSVLPAVNIISGLTPGKAYQFSVFREGNYLEYVVTISAKI
jgi:S1-C subfamily serine protease